MITYQRGNDANLAGKKIKVFMFIPEEKILKEVDALLVKLEKRSGFKISPEVKKLLKRDFCSKLLRLEVSKGYLTHYGLEKVIKNNYSKSNAINNQPTQLRRRIGSRC